MITNGSSLFPLSTAEHLNAGLRAIATARRSTARTLASTDAPDLIAPRMTRKTPDELATVLMSRLEQLIVSTPGLEALLGEQPGVNDTTDRLDGGLKA